MTDGRLHRLWTDPERRRWLAFGALAATYALVSVYRLSTAVLADELTRAFSVTGAQLGTLHASFFYVYAAMQLPAGVFADRLGSRRTVAVGAVVMSLGGFAFAFADSYVAAFAGRALIGFGGSVLFIAILRFCAN
ncbi:MAG: MFS transporter, partial [Natronomonas sp.]